MTATQRDGGQQQSRRKTFVLGANSFSGQDFVDLLLEDANNEVIGISRSPERDDLFLRYKLRQPLENYRYFQIDLNSDLDRLFALLWEERPSEIVNFAAQSEVAPSWDHPEHWFQTNCASFSRLINFLRQESFLERFLQISSPEVYGNCVGHVDEAYPLNPSTPYAVSKAAADMLLETYRREFNFPVVTVRATNVYGSRQQLFKIIPRSAIYIRKNCLISLHGGGLAVKSYIHIRDVSRGELSVLRNGRLGEIYHLSPDEGIAVRNVVEQMARRFGKSLGEVAEVVEERPGQDAAYVIDSAKARTELSWKPRILFSEGIDEVVEWVNEYWDIILQQPLDYQHRA